MVCSLEGQVRAERGGRWVFRLLVKCLVAGVVSKVSPDGVDGSSPKWTMPVESQITVGNVLSLTSNTQMQYFQDMWYAVFLWCLFSSLFIYLLAAMMAFTTLRKHKFGRFYSVMILLMGVVIPLSLGMLSSAAIAFVYKTSSFKMDPTHAMMWGVGQTVIHAAVGFTRILATL